VLYRTLGKTGLEVSQLGFGCMRLPMVGEGEQARIDRDRATPMIRRAVEAGVNYIDTAVFYCNHDSQAAVGEALDGIRDRVVLSTKNHCYDDEKQWWRNLEDSLRFLRTDYIDLYNFHGIQWKRYVEDIEPRMYAWMEKARDRGMIRHICCSFHDSAEAMRKVVDTGRFESITVQYNMLNQDFEEAIAHAHEQGMGVVIMGPVGGGRLGVTSEVLQKLVPGVERVPELALRFVLANPNVTVALSGMSTIEQVEENLAVASDPVALTDEHRALIDEHLERLKNAEKRQCTGCKYCMPCDAGVNIPAILAQYNLARIYGLTEAAAERYGKLIAKGVAADACTECGACEDACPQDLDIRDQLKATHQMLAKS